MGDSLREQLLRSGLAKSPRKHKSERPKRGARKHQARPSSQPAPGDADVDLARAWALRDRAESAERKRAKAAAEAEARARKERLQRLREVLDGKALNADDAELARHFEYGGRIRRIYVSTEQLAQLNAGQLGVVQLKGGYVLVTRAVAEQVRDFAPDHVALLIDPDAGLPDDGIPDDLTW